MVVKDIGSVLGDDALIIRRSPLQGGRVNPVFVRQKFYSFIPPPLLRVMILIHFIVPKITKIYCQVISGNSKCQVIELKNNLNTIILGLFIFFIYLL